MQAIEEINQLIRDNAQKDGAIAEKDRTIAELSGSLAALRSKSAESKELLALMCWPTIPDASGRPCAASSPRIAYVRRSAVVAIFDAESELGGLDSVLYPYDQPIGFELEGGSRVFADLPSVDAALALVAPVAPAKGK